MHLDVRIPLGLLLAILGLILLVYGLIADPAMYAVHSLGQNLNVRWDAVFIVCGVAILASTRRR